MRIDIEKATSRLIFLCWMTIFVCLILNFFGYKGFEIPYIKNDINIWYKRFIRRAPLWIAHSLWEC